MHLRQLKILEGNRTLPSQAWLALSLLCLPALKHLNHEAMKACWVDRGNEEGDTILIELQRCQAARVTNTKPVN